ncbi:MAG: cysteine desulfurase, partial [Bacilli bacterium]|nr:cysteine desulfurase [Bacilli bacterium]
KARDSILESFNVKSHQVIFTSSSTEANNLAIKGYCLAHQNRGNHIITTNIEHPSVLECFKQLKEQFNFKVTILEVDENGCVRLDDLKQALNNSTILVSIMAVNNEIGSINDIASISKIVKGFPKAVLHVDTTQAIGKVDLPYQDIDMFVVSSHKIHGLKGSGCLLARKNISFLPLISGGGQEASFRSGTQSLALACTLAKVLKEAFKAQKENNYKIIQINNYLRLKLAKIDGIHINSSEKASPYILNFSLLNKKASVVVEALSNDGIYVSSVSSCHSKREESSYVVEAITHDEKLASNTIRLSFGKDNTMEEAEEFIASLTHILENIK